MKARPIQLPGLAFYIFTYISSLKAFSFMLL